jgi:hypothetical protein
MLTFLRIVVGLVLVALLAVGALWAAKAAGYGYLLAVSQDPPEPVRPDIPFAPLTDASLHDPDNPTKVFRVDMAKVEHDFPLTRAQLAGLEPRHILSLSQEEIDQLYGRLSAGPIPDGPYLGDLFFARGDALRPRLEEILGGIEGRVAAEKLALAEAAGRALWKGKMFYRDERQLRNFIEDFRPLAGLIDDPRALPTAEVPREGRLRHVLPTTTVWLLFPAKLYCGQSLLDGRRESIVIDYAYSDELPGYQDRPDALVGRNGLRIRDEIRMVRPGLYLGRAYANRIFLLNFVLYNAEVAEAGLAGFAAGEPVAEDCWSGEQVRAAAAP